MTATVSKWARRYVLASVFALLCWQVGALVGAPTRTEVVLGVFGFVLHMIFGKAYALVPAYFESQLAFSRGPAVQFPFVVGGTAGLAASSLDVGPAWVAPASAGLWLFGVAVFVATLGVTIAPNVYKGETGTGEHNAALRPIDRLANAFVPVALSYLLVGSYETAALYGAVPPIFDGVSAQASHLLAAGTGALLVFALGFRLLPRFLGARPPVWAVQIVLPAATVGPALIVVGIATPSLLLVGALLEAIAVCLFALALFRMGIQSDRRRIGIYGVLAGAVFGVGGVLVGVSFAFDTAAITGPMTMLHLRFNVLGFLGLTIIGMAYQFYPPSIGRFRGSSNRTAFVSIFGIALGLLFHAASVLAGSDGLATVGTLSTLGGSIAYAYLLLSVFATRK